MRSQHGLITTLAHKLGPAASVQYALEGAIAVGGAGVSWLRDNLGLIGSAAEVEQLAGSVDSTEGVSSSAERPAGHDKLPLTACQHGRAVLAPVGL